MEDIYLSPYRLLECFLTLLEVKCSSSLKKICLVLPFMDTLYGYSIVLKKYHVENWVIDLGEQKREVMSCQLPAIVPFENDFVILLQISESIVCYWKNGKQQFLSLNDFLDKWSGIILLAEKNEYSKEPDYKFHLVSQIFRYCCVWLILMSILGCLLIIIKMNHPYEVGILFAIIISIIGAYISFLLYQIKFHLSNFYVDKVCSSIKGASCKQVVNSAEGEFFGVVSWSEIGLSYFLSTILLLLSYPQYYIFFYCVSTLVLPYSLWSIWCQKVKLRQWCVLCLVVQALLWLTFLNNLVFFHNKLCFPTDIWPWLITLVIYGLPFSLLFLYTLKRKERQEMGRAYRKFLKLKYDDELFKYLLCKSDKYLDYIGVSSILVGNKNAKVIVTVITNLFCSPCAYMHSRIKALEEQLEEDVCIQYIFLSPTKEIEKYSKGLISLYKRKGEYEFLQSLDHWFKNDRTDIDNEINNEYYNLECDSESEYMKHKSFIDKYSIYRTPTVLINGCVLPDLYGVEDLIYML